MTNLLTKGAATNVIVSVLHDICHKLMFKRLTWDQVKAVEAHFETMKAQPEAMNTKVTFETNPELRLTRITIESAFEGS